MGRNRIDKEFKYVREFIIKVEVLLKENSMKKWIEKRLLNILRSLYERQISEEFDSKLSQKLDTIIFLIETNRTRYEQNDSTQSSAGLSQNGI